LRDSGIDKRNSHEGVNVQAMVQEYFDSQELSKSIIPDEDMAFDAAVQAAILTGKETLR
jgi:molecular chaperone DnaK (HSP70)